MSNKVCVYAICKQESKEAEAWYENIKMADYVIVLDTGSTDGTPSLLESLGCTVFSKEYDDFRFDTARNDALDLAMELTDANIFVTTDFDERFDPGWYEYICENWDDEVHTRGSYDYYVYGSPLAGSLNWIHDRCWKWKYPCHEVMERRDGTGVSYSIKNELNMRDGKVTVYHKQDHTKKTRGQYLDLLRRRFDEYRDQESLAYLLREFMYKGLHDEALTYVDVANEMKLSGNVGSWALLSLAWAYERKNDVDSAEGLLMKGFILDTENRTVPTKLAELLYRDGKYAFAAAVLEQMFECADVYKNRFLFVDHPDVWQWRSEDWLGACYMKLHRYKEALSCFEHALKGTEDDEAARKHVLGNLEHARKMVSIYYK